jgi:hypothetical protein
MITFGLLFLLGLNLVAAVHQHRLTGGVGNITHVHLIFMNHLDIGFDGIDPVFGFAANVINKYFTVYFPKAIDTAEQLAQRGGPEQLIYTTHAWLVSFYLDCSGLPSVPQWNATVTCPTAAEKARFIKAIANGWITWHGFPFNGEPELMDASMLSFGVKMSHDLDRKFHNGTLRRVVSQRDVPGMTRASIPLWLAAGIDMLTVGVNGGSAPPGVPRQFVWRDPVSNTSILALWHPSGYGGHEVSDFAFAGNGHVLVPCFKGDNAGPPSVVEVLSTFQLVRAEVPASAQVFASTWEAFADQLELNRAQLPVVESEIGDTWIHGSQADPVRQAKFRAAMRSRTACEAAGQCLSNEARYHNFSRILIKAAEHTFGGDKKKFVHDWMNWDNPSYARVIGSDNWQRFIATWREQRSFLDIALDALGSHPLAAQISAEWAALTPAAAPSLVGFSKTIQRAFTCGATKVVFNSTAGGFDQINGATGQIAQFAYTSLNGSDFDRFFGTYCNCAILHVICQQWAQMDFTPIGLRQFANPESRTWLGEVVGGHLWQNDSNPCHFRQVLAIDSNAVQNYGAPATVQQDFVVGSSSIAIDVQLFNKTATRIPETVWVKFDLNGTGDTWTLEKMGQVVDVHDVVLNGSARNHAITKAFSASGLTLSSPDVALATIGERFALPTVAVPASKSDKAHLSYVLRNNLWQTNYVDAYPFDSADANLRSRFNIAV